MTSEAAADILASMATEHVRESCQNRRNHANTTYTAAKPERALGGEEFSIFEPLALEYLAAGFPEKMKCVSWT
jgi:hypothetical protein